MKLVAALVSIIVVASAAPTLPEEDTSQELAPSFSDVVGNAQLEHTMDAAEDGIPDPTHEDENIETNRKKKSATTTFCVEVKPNNPYQKPYELCESGNEIYAVQSSEAHYNPPAAPAAAPPAPVYGQPPKTYTAVASSSGYVQSAPALHSNGYKSSKTYEAKKYRANEDMTMEDNSEEDEGHDSMRSAYGYGGGDYGGGYGGYGSGMVKFIANEDKKLKKKGHGHSGVVITCQPNLAGYASPAHAPSPGYGPVYRNSMQEDKADAPIKHMEEPTLARSYSHHTGGLSSSYSSYGYGIPSSRPMSAQHSAPAVSYQSYSAPASSYGPPAPVYPAPTYSAPSYAAPAPPPSYSPPAPAYPAPAPPPPYSPPSHSYPAPPPRPTPVYTYGPPPPQPAPVSYKPHKVVTTYTAPSYSAPGTYRNSEDEATIVKMENAENKETRTMETMKKMAEEMSMRNKEMRNNIEQQKDMMIANEEKKME